MTLAQPGAILAGVILLLWSTEAGARQGEDALNAGVRHFDALQQKRSMKALVRARTLARDHRVLGKIHLYLGLNYLVMGSRSAAKKAMITAILLDPTLTLDPYRFKPRFVEFFRSVRRFSVGELSVRADVTGAEVLVDGRARGKLPTRVILGAGTHLMEVRGPRAQGLISRRITIEAGKELEIEARLSPQLGWLTVESTPPGALVVLDGAPIGKTPLTGIPVATGRRRLALRLPRRRPRSVQVKIDAGRKVAVKMMMADRGQHGFLGGRRWTWVAAGSAALAATIGIGLGASVVSDREEYEAMDPNDARALDQMESSIRARARATSAMFGLAGVLAIGAVAIFLYEGGFLGRRGDGPAPAIVTLLSSSEAGALMKVKF